MKMKWAMVFTAFGLLVAQSPATTGPQTAEQLPPGVRCTGERIDSMHNTGALVAMGNAECTFQDFGIRGDRIEIHLAAKVPGSPLLIMAQGNVVLRQGAQELHLRTLTLETEVSR